ncbi:MAG: DUF2934 domain-containing protein [Candidatus Obscuribacterales bacterium]|nr:DUF2934 domain-containing protein [Candidatus Obscuribacterales bacterium]
MEPDPEQTSTELGKARCLVCQQNAENIRKKISDRAYQIYLEEGYPVGRTTENWYEAELELALVEEHCQPTHVAVVAVQDLSNHQQNVRL